MDRGSLSGNEQTEGDLTVREPFGQQGGDLAFACSQFASSGTRSGAEAADERIRSDGPPTRPVLEEAAGPARVHTRLIGASDAQQAAGYSLVGVRNQVRRPVTRRICQGFQVCGQRLSRAVFGLEQCALDVAAEAERGIWERWPPKVERVDGLPHDAGLGSATQQRDSGGHERWTST